jgi:hypothetical protein
MNPNLIELQNFIAQNNIEKTLYNSIYNKNIIQKYLDNINDPWYNKNTYYWLGEKIPITSTEKITSNLIKLAWNKIKNSPNYAFNSWKYLLDSKAKTDFITILKIIEKYNEIQRIRFEYELEKNTKLPIDICKLIMLFI